MEKLTGAMLRSAKEDVRVLALEIIEGYSLDDKRELLKEMRYELMRLEDEIEGAEDENEF